MQKQLLGRRHREQAYGTVKRDEIVWRTRVYASALGRKPLDKITEDDCQAFIDAQTHQLKAVFEKDPETGKNVIITDPVTGEKRPRWKVVKTNVPLAADGVKRIGASLSVYFEIARKKPFKYIASNPMDEVEYPKTRKGSKQRKSLTPKEAASLQGALLKFITELRAQGTRFEAMVLTVRDTGLRGGELCGITRDRVLKSKHGPFILVDNAQVRTAGGIGDSSTKTDRVREVPIGEDTYEMIMALPARKDPVTGKTYAFSTESGRPVRRDNFSRDFRKFRDAIGMPSLRAHNLRHTYISLMLRAGVDLKTIQKNVGHASPAMIMKIYGETFDDQQRASVCRFKDVLAEAAKELEKQA